MESWDKMKQNIVSKFDKGSQAETEALKVDPEQRLEKLKELGVTMDLEGYDWGCLGGDRFYVFVNLNGTPVPMYKTSARTGGKRHDTDFFPFFGTQESNQDWLIKGDPEKETNDFYGKNELEEASKILTKVFDFDTDRKIRIPDPTFNSQTHSPWEKSMQVDNYVPGGKEIPSSESLNELLSHRFDIDFDKVNQYPAYSLEAVKYVSDKIFKDSVK